MVPNKPFNLHENVIGRKELNYNSKGLYRNSKIVFPFFWKKKNPPESNTRGKYKKTKSKQRLTNYSIKIHVKTSTQIPKS